MSVENSEPPPNSELKFPNLETAQVNGQSASSKIAEILERHGAKSDVIKLRQKLSLPDRIESCLDDYAHNGQLDLRLVLGDVSLYSLSGQAEFDELSKKIKREENLGHIVDSAFQKFIRQELPNSLIIDSEILDEIKVSYRILTHVVRNQVDFNQSFFVLLDRFRQKLVNLKNKYSTDFQRLSEMEDSDLLKSRPISSLEEISQDIKRLEGKVSEFIEELMERYIVPNTVHPPALSLLTLLSWFEEPLQQVEILPDNKLIEDISQKLPILKATTIKQIVSVLSNSYRISVIDGFEDDYSLVTMDNQNESFLSSRKLVFSIAELISTLLLDSAKNTQPIKFDQIGDLSTFTYDELLDKKNSSVRVKFEPFIDPTNQRSCLRLSIANTKQLNSIREGVESTGQGTDLIQIILKNISQCVGQEIQPPVRYLYSQTGDRETRSSQSTEYNIFRDALPGDICEIQFVIPLAV